MAKVLLRTLARVRDTSRPAPGTSFSTLHQSSPTWRKLVCWKLGTLVFIVTASACQSTMPTRSNIPVTTAGQSISNQQQQDPQVLLRQAEQERGRGQHSAADLSFLRAAAGFLNLGNYLGAKSAFTDIGSRQAPGLAVRETLESTLGDRLQPPSGLPAALYARVGADLAIEAGQLPIAQEFLFSIRPLSDDDPNATGRLNAKLCAAQEHWACAVQALINVRPGSGLKTANETRRATPSQGLPGRNTSTQSQDSLEDPIQAHNDQIWHYINRAPLINVQEQSQRSAGIEQGWWQLQLAAVSGFSAADQRRAIEQWRSKHPNHPAQAPWPVAIHHALNPSWAPQRVALLVPLTGPLKAAGRALRNGFVSAYLFDESTYELQLFDSATEDLGAVLQDIMAWQANVIIGPLAKEKLQTLNRLNPEVPVLGLNYLDAGETPQPNLLQLGLAIEDEADTLVDRLLADGASNLLVVHSDADWAKRAAARIAATWPLAATIEEVESVALVTEAVGRGMHVDDSHRRSQQIYRTLGTHIEFMPRARQDLDAVVALLDNTEANALVPALKFHFAQQLPVYASAQVLRGARSDKLAELKGMRVSDLPWNMQADSLATTVQDSFGLAGSSLTSLYALGADAYRVTDRLASLLLSTDIGLLGNTGVLSVNQDRRFRRQQAWGVVQKRRLVPLPYATSGR